MIDVTAHPVQTEHRAGRMLEALLTATNKGAKMLLTTDLMGEDGSNRYHQTFALRRWKASDEAEMLSVSVHGSGDWACGIKPITVMTIDLSRRRVKQSGDRRADDRLLQYAAECAVVYAWLGVLPEPKNGSVAVVEADLCSRCGRELTDPVSIGRGIGPECFGKATGTRTITGRAAAPLAGQEALA